MLVFRSCAWLQAVRARHLPSEKRQSMYVTKRYDTEEEHEEEYIIMYDFPSNQGIQERMVL
jgi:hypothetical protein